MISIDVRPRAALLGVLVSGWGCSVDTRAFETGGGGTSGELRTIEPALPGGPGENASAGGSVGMSSGGTSAGGTSSGAGELPPDPNTVGLGGAAPGGSAGEPPPVPPAPFVPTLPAPVVAACPGQSLTFDQTFALVAQDLAALSDDDVLFTRYVSLGNQFSAGVCSAQLERERAALAKALNMVSREATVVAPEAVDANRLVYRIDLRDYGWEDSITVSNISFSDAWEALGQRTSLTASFAGDDVDDAIVISGTVLPLMLSNDVIHAAMSGPLYYALVGLEAREPLAGLVVDQLAIDVEQNVLDAEVARAGTTASRAVTAPVLVERHAIGSRPGALWQATDLSVSGNDRFGALLAPTVTERRTMFTLPNGLFGFIVSDSTEEVQLASTHLNDAIAPALPASPAVSCSACHESGLIPVVDDVRSTVLTSGPDLGLSNAEVQQLALLYVTAADFQSLIDGDNARFTAGLRAAGVPLSGGDPVAATFYQFEADVDLATVAGDLGLTADQLRANLNLLDPQLTALATGGRITRDEWVELYHESLCVIQLAGANQLAPELCDAGP